MNRTDTAKALAIAAGFDNRRPDELQVAAWSELLGGYTLAEVRVAILDHYRDTETRHKYLTAAHVLDRCEAFARLRRVDVMADVRAAKARGLVSADWPTREPLPADIAGNLQLARERDRAEAAKYELEAGS